MALQSADIELRRERHFGNGKWARGEAALWGLALTCDDLDRAKDTLGGMLSDPKTAVQPGRRIATLRTRDLDISAPIVLLSPHLSG